MVEGLSIDLSQNNTDIFDFEISPLRSDGLLNLTHTQRKGFLHQFSYFYFVDVCAES